MASYFSIFLLQTALTPFEGLCGFRPLAEIQKYVETVPELAAVIGQETATALTSGSGLSQPVLFSEDVFATDLRMVPSFAIGHMFCASRDGTRNYNDFFRMVATNSKVFLHAL